VASRRLRTWRIGATAGACLPRRGQTSRRERGRRATKRERTRRGRLDIMDYCLRARGADSLDSGSPLWAHACAVINGEVREAQVDHEHAELSGFPANRVSRVAAVLDPASAET
jgi:hypothetical protein